MFRLLWSVAVVHLVLGDTTLYFKPQTRPVSAVNVVCPDQSTCPDGATCCQLASGQYGCCPLSQAVCCSDHLHCCPNGSKCAPEKQTCIHRNGLHTAWYAKTPASQPHSIMCPDKRSMCPDRTTCCQIDHGHFGCCPFPKAECCHDHRRCCPHGFQCDERLEKCVRANSMDTLPWAEKFPATPYPGLQGVDDVVCPGGQFQCPTGNTCCKQKSGDWGCCPLPQAVCCSDLEHCCPSGYTCDVKHATCKKTQAIDVVAWLALTGSRKVEGKDVVCPGGQSSCPDGTTCCKLQSGGFGCCPYPLATCCEDKLHCCPHGYACDVALQTCTKAGAQATLMSLLQTGDKMDSTRQRASQVVALGSKKPIAKVTDVKCKDGSRCPVGTTCCMMKSGKYGCCPMPEAICCSDKIHCCPKGTKCDVQHGTCTSAAYQMPWKRKIPAKPIVPEMTLVMCKDNSTKCEDTQTCCQLATGGFGCCPLKDAVCCSDHIHCCPKGYKCNIAKATCDSERGWLSWRKSEEPMKHIEDYHTMPLLTKVPARPVATVKGKVVHCPDGQSVCSDGQTCCRSKTGSWNCCPLPQAVCCTDGEHCCPHGYTCDVAHLMCHDTKPLGMTWLSHLSSKPVEGSTDDNVLCPGGQVTCPAGNTCCVEPSGQWGCCPLPKAVCCSDKLHCCPEGYTCDVVHQMCNKQIPVVGQQPQHSVVHRAGVVVCPDQKSECPSGQTCCQNAEGTWECCPFPEAVCCSDHEHCCPSGTTCNLAEGTCDREPFGLPWLRQHDTQQPGSPPANSVVCPDGQSMCDDKQTCCQTAQGQWACCPLPKATCCNDHEHCCPNGYRCDTASATCMKDLVSFPWVGHVSSPLPHAGVKMIVCPDGASQCADDQTCCQMASGVYACCPLPQAVCCEDHAHCCPSGYTCNVRAQTCEKSQQVLPWFAKQSATPTPSPKEDPDAEIVVCPDKKSACEDGQTCCRLKSGEWGCCPYAKAICCSDGLHCCPAGTKCDEASQRCISTTDSLTVSYTWLKRSERVRVLQSKVSTIKCDDGTRCKDGNTCCLQAGGKTYACCPLPDAVCCDDHIHCCPSGTTCNITAGKCDKPGLSVSMTFYARRHAQRPESLPTKPQRGNVVCPDGTSECPDGNTCCKLSTGQWGCCPMPSAVCCSDGEHCCPSGYTCDRGQCNKGEMTGAATVLKAVTSGGQ